jgi:Co/Zn/Cd efflux system component
MDNNIDENSSPNRRFRDHFEYENKFSNDTLNNPENYNSNGNSAEINFKYYKTNQIVKEDRFTKNNTSDNKNTSSQSESGEIISSIKEQTEMIDRHTTSQNPNYSNSSDSLIKAGNDNHSENENSLKLDLKVILNSSYRLIKTNDEFFYLVIFLSIWLCLIFAEFLYGITQSKVHIISDSFFNLFKSVSILITVFSILLTRVYHFNSIFLRNRIELIAALSNIIFLIIVSMYMCLQALHIVTETDDGDMPEHSHNGHDDDEAGTIKFFNYFFIFKIVVDAVIILNLSDYILHPSIQIKLLLWKRSHSWKSLGEFDIENLKECRHLIKIWNNHFENMNALIINMSSDLISSILFLIWFYISKDQHFEYAYCFISLINLVVVIIFINPVINSVFRVLMQGKTEVYESFYQKLQNEISYYEGCLGIKEMKIWMTAQNDIKCKKYLNYIFRLYPNLWS